MIIHKPDCILLPFVHKECLFGDINHGEMVWNDAGIMIKNKWLGLKNRYPNIDLHEYIVMPNHFHGHGIIQIVGASGQPQGIAPTVGNIIGAFKSLVTNEYIRNVKQNNWQRFNGAISKPSNRLPNMGKS